MSGGVKGRNVSWGMIWAVEPGHWISAYQGTPGLPGFGGEQSQCGHALTYATLEDRTARWRV